MAGSRAAGGAASSARLRAAGDLRKLVELLRCIAPGLHRPACELWATGRGCRGSSFSSRALRLARSSHLPRRASAAISDRRSSAVGPAVPARAQAAGRTGPEPGERGTGSSSSPPSSLLPQHQLAHPLAQAWPLSASSTSTRTCPTSRSRTSRSRRGGASSTVRPRSPTRTRAGRRADLELSLQAPRAWSPALSPSQPRPASRSFGWAATRRKQVRVALSSHLRVVRRGSMRRWIRYRWRAEGPAHSSLRKEADPVLLLLPLLPLLPHQPSPSLRPST